MSDKKNGNITISVGGSVSGKINAAQGDIHDYSSNVVSTGPNGETMVELRCKNCGGKLVVTEAELQENFIKTADGGYVMIKQCGKHLKCENCDTEFMPGSQLNCGSTTIVVED